MRYLSSLLTIFIAGSISAQVSNSLGVWVDHLPYGVAVDVEEDNEKTYVATEQGLFIYDVFEKTIERISKVNGLSDVGLTDIAWSDRHQALLIGYENGNLDILRGSRVSNYPDLRLSSNYSGLKRINHIHIDDELAYLSTNFGILSFDIEEELVLETYLFGPGGGILASAMTSTDQDSLYAATEDGLYSVALNDPKFFFDNWRRSKSKRRPLDQVCVFNDLLFVNRNIPPNGDSIYYRESGTWQHFDLNEIANNRDIREDKGYLMISNNFSARAYDTAFVLFKNFNGSSVNDTAFSPVGAELGADPQNFWMADNGQGLFHAYQLFPFQIRPNSPASKAVLQMFNDGQRHYVAPGGINDVGTPQFNNDGFFSLEEFEWTNFTPADFGGYKDIVDVVSDPEDPDHLFASAYGTGLLELQRSGDQLSVVRLINESSTQGVLPSIDGVGGHRMADLAFDADGNLWFSNSLTDKPLGVVRPDGSIEAFSLGAAGSGANVLKIMPTSIGQVWLQLRNNGILVVKVDEPANIETVQLSTAEGSGNLPSATVLSFAEDLDGEIWIGTNEGLAVLFSPENIFVPNRSYDASILVIDEDGDGNGERVLGSEAITDIAVDGSNKKWFATANSGVFFTSGNGRTQLRRFTKENSPLPSNILLDIEIDSKTGMVYFGTGQGIVSFQGSATEGEEFMTDVFAYPNPVQPDYQGPILIRGLVTNAQVKITDMEGNLVFETVAEGGQAIWSGKKFNGERVRSGVYLAYITDDLGTNTEVAKILIVN